MKTAITAVTLSLLSVLVVAPVSAGTVLYSNGPVDSTIDGWAINFDESVSDSFTVSQTAIVTGVLFGGWAFHGDTLDSVQWLIGTAPFADDSGTGSSSVSQSYLTTNIEGFDVNLDSFDLASPVTLAPGTYYLTLENAAGTDGDPFYWDENDGPSIAFDSTYGSIGSESFSILTTPEPNLGCVVALFMIGLAYAVRYRNKPVGH